MMFWKEHSISQSAHLSSALLLEQVWKTLNKKIV